MSVTITVADGTITLAAPYHPEMPDRAPMIGGEFDRSAGVWRFDARDEERVRELARELYGTDGTEPLRLVTVRIDLDEWSHRLGRSRNGETLWLAGRKVATRPGRDLPVRLGKKVVVIEGGFDSSGGSVKNPRLDPKPGTVLEIRDLPAGHADLDDKLVTVVDEQAAGVEALRAERERLLARVAEIDAQLGGASASVA